MLFRSEAGEWSGDGWVINSGLKPGERVITDGVMKIGPGAPVQIAAPPAAGAPGEAAVNAPAKAPANDKGAAKK